MGSVSVWYVCVLCVWCVHVWCVWCVCVWCVCACIYIGVSVCVYVKWTEVWAPLLAHCLCLGLPHPPVALGPLELTGWQRRRALGCLVHGDFGPSPPYWACWPLGHDLASAGFEGLPEMPSGLGGVLRLDTACWPLPAGLWYLWKQPSLTWVGTRGGAPSWERLLWVNLVSGLGSATKVQRALDKLLPTGSILSLPRGELISPWVCPGWASSAWVISWETDSDVWSSIVLVSTLVCKVWRPACVSLDECLQNPRKSRIYWASRTLGTTGWAPSSPLAQK